MHGVLSVRYRLEDAIQVFNKSLTEHRNADTLAKLNAAEKALKDKREAEYINMDKSNEEKVRMSNTRASVSFSGKYGYPHREQSTNGCCMPYKPFAPKYTDNGPFALNAHVDMWHAVLETCRRRATQRSRSSGTLKQWPHTRRRSNAARPLSTLTHSRSTQTSQQRTRS